MSERNLLVDEVVEYLTTHPDEPLEQVLFHQFPGLTVAEFEAVSERFRVATMQEEATDGHA